MKIRAILHILLLAVLASFPMKAWGDVVVDRVVALVNNDPVTLSEVLKEAEGETIELIKKFKGQDREREIAALNKRVLQDIVEKRLQLQEAIRLGIEISEGEVDDAVADVKSRMGLDEAGLRQMIFSQKLTPDEFRSQLKEFLAIVRLVEQEVNSRVVVTRESIDAYYKEHSREFVVADGIRVSQIFLSLSIRRGSDEVARVMGKVMDIQQRLKQGETFESLAVKYSEDPSAEHGGDMGFFKYGDMMPALEKAVAGLKPGETGEPVWSENGVHIVKLIERSSGRLKSFDEVKDEIETRLRNELLESNFHKFISGLKGKAYIDIRM